MGGPCHFLRRKLVRRAAPGVLATVLLAAAAACSPSGDSGTNTLERVRRDGVARIGFANEAPFAYLETDSGRLTGEAPEIARVVLRALGVESVHGVLTEFGSLIPGLKAGRFDLIAAGMYITPARCLEVDFSHPTYALGEAFLVRKGNPHGLHGYEDVARKPAVRLGVMAGAVEQDYARRAGVPDEQVVAFPDPPSGLAGVLADRIDAFAATALTARDLLDKAKTDRVEAAKPFRDLVLDGETVRGFGAFAFRRGDEEFRGAFDARLREFLGSPEHLRLVRPFGFTETEMPGGVTVSELCRPRAAQQD